MKKLSESVWNDIRKRGNGSEIKKEDDVNLMDAEGFVKYIENNYILDKPINFEPGEDEILIHIFNRDNFTSMLWLDYNHIGSDEAYVSFGGDLKRTDYVLFTKLQNRYNLSKSNQFKTYRLLKINKHAPTNKDFLELLDFVIDNLSNTDDILIVKQ